MPEKKVLSLIGLLLLSACTNENCDPVRNSLTEGGGLNFQLVDARTGLNLVSQTPGSGSPYYPDSVMVYNEMGEPQFKGPVKFNGEITFSAYGSTRELRALPFHTPIFRRFTLFLNQADQDTIDVVFRLRKNDCGFSEYETITISYNTVVVYEGSKTTEIPSRVFLKYR